MKKLLVLLALALLVISICSVAEESEEREIFKSGDYEYALLADGIRIAGRRIKLFQGEMNGRSFAPQCGVPGFIYQSLCDILITDQLSERELRIYDSLFVDRIINNKRAEVNAQIKSDYYNGLSEEQVIRRAADIYIERTAVMLKAKLDFDDDRVREVTDELYARLDGATSALISEADDIIQSVNRNNAEITKYRGEAEALDIPSELDGYTVTSIGEGAFSGRRSLTAVTIPDSVTSIGNGAFSGCASLVAVTVPESVTSIGKSAFSACTSLTAVTIPDSVTSIGDMSFYYCTSLAAVTIPDSVKTIGDYAFSFCEGLTAVMLPDSVTSIGDTAFYGCPDSLMFTVDRDSYALQYCRENGYKYTFSN